MLREALPNRTPNVLPVLALALIAAAGAGCSGTGKPTDLPEAEGSKLIRPAQKPTAKSKYDELNQAALDLQAMFDHQGEMKDPAGADATVPDSAPTSPQRSPRPSAAPPAVKPAEPSAPSGAAASASSQHAPAAPAADTRPLAQRQREAAQALADLLRPEVGAAREPLKAAIPLLALNALAPGSAKDAIDAIENAVSPDQRRSLEALRAVLKAADTDPGIAAGDPDAVSRVLKDYGERLQPAPPPESLGIDRAVLCTRVEAFGRYTPITTSTFLTGRVNTVILYTEPRNFGHASKVIAESATGDSGWSVELAQSVTLHLDADGSEQLVIPEVIIKDTSRSRRRDFYLVQRLELPKTLSVGNYNLKVRIRDLVSGGMAEQTIPLRIVADRSALRSGQ